MLSETLKSSLLSTQLCRYLEPREFDLLIGHNQTVSFAQDDTLLQQGKKAIGMYIIIEGTGLVTAKILGEGVTQIGTVGPGDLVGEISLIENSPCVTSVIASTDMQCLLITRAYFQLLTLFYPETKYKITRTIARQVCGRLKFMHKKITNFIKKSEMTTQSLFGEVIKSLNKPIPISFDESDANIKALRQSPLFSTFNQKESNEILKYTSLIKAAKNCTLIHENETNAPAYIVINGAVQSSIVQDNKIAKLSVFGPHEFFCSISTIENEAVSIINYTTCENAILLKMNPIDLSLLQKNNVQLWYKLFDYICKSFVGLERAADELDIRLNVELYNR